MTGQATPELPHLRSGVTTAPQAADDATPRVTLAADADTERREPPLEPPAPGRITRREAITTVHVSERTAREMLLLRAFEQRHQDGDDDNPLWTHADAVWANRVAADTAGAHATPQTYLESRAHAAMQRLAPRSDAVRTALNAKGWRWGLLPLTIIVALALGAIVYDIGTNQRIDLLSMPVWVVVAWNLVVYAALLVAMLRRLSRKHHQPSGLRAFISKHLGARPTGLSRKQPALTAFAGDWSKASWPITLARAGSVLHIGAAALALGLIAGMYLRGLVLDYRAGWQSTFLSTPQVRDGLKVALAPASRLTAIALPDEAALDALRIGPGQEAKGEAANWIHLYAATLLLFVVAPRLLLALGSVLRGAWLARRMPVDVADGYHQRLLQQHGLQTASVRVHPHGAMPNAMAALGLQKLVSRVFGDRAELAIAPLALYGSEELVASNTALESDTVKLALFDLSATPEMEAQGRFLRALRERSGPGSNVVILVDEAAFNSRFTGATERVAQRRSAWDQLAQKLELPAPVFVNLHALDAVAAGTSLEAVLRGEAGTPPVERTRLF
jgi:hypothetical protein